MTLLSIELDRFRNFPELGLSLDPKGAVLEAPNGSGKTNFLEALHYLNLFRSFRGAPDAELASFGEDGFRVRGSVTEDGGRPREVGVAVEGPRKRVLLDGRPARPAAQIGTALSVVVCPSDIGLVQGSPARRRRYLDLLLALSSGRYLRALRDYRRALDQRNRVLQTGWGVSRPALLDPWTEGVAVHGGVILEERHRFLGHWGPRFAEISAHLAAGSGALAWRYESSLSRAPAVRVGETVATGEATGIGERKSAESYAAVLRAELERRTSLEQKRGTTLAGPHRDDLAFFAQGPAGAERDLRSFGSQGEQRTAALALRFLEVEALARERGQLPVVLLDDVFSELDPLRSRQVLSLLVPEQQVFLTTPKPLALDLLPVELPRYRVSAGAVCRT